MQRDACGRIGAEMEAWRRRLPGDLGAVPIEASEVIDVSGRAATFTVIRRELSDGDTLVVFQVFVPTWSKPTFLSVGAVGRIYAEGLVIRRAGAIEAAPDELMWEFR